MRSKFFLIALNQIKDISAQVIEQDSIALVALYKSTNGFEWNNNSNWLSKNPVSTWYGVTVYKGRLVKLNLNFNGLEGPILPLIGNLTNLVSLNLQSNHLSGEIPSKIGNLTNLEELILAVNKLDGIYNYGFSKA